MATQNHAKNEQHQNHRLRTVSRKYLLGFNKHSLECEDLHSGFRCCSKYLYYCSINNLQLTAFRSFYCTYRMKNSKEIISIVWFMVFSTWFFFADSIKTNKARYTKYTWPVSLLFFKIRFKIKCKEVKMQGAIKLRNNHGSSILMKLWEKLKTNEKNIRAHACPQNTGNAMGKLYFSYPRIIPRRLKWWKRHQGFMPDYFAVSKSWSVRMGFTFWYKFLVSCTCSKWGRNAPSAFLSFFPAVFGDYWTWLEMLTGANRTLHYEYMSSLKSDWRLCFSRCNFVLYVHGCRRLRDVRR